MKKLFRFIIVFPFVAAVSFLSAALVRFANATSHEVKLPNPLTVTSFFELIDRVIQLIFIAGLAVSPVFFIWGGFMFITAAGDARKVTSAANIIKYTVIGLVVIIFARAIVLIIKSAIGG